MNKKLQSDLLLLLTAIIWGSAFVAQKAGAVLEPFTYNGIRMLIGGLVFNPVIFHIQSKKKEVIRRQKESRRKGSRQKDFDNRRHLLRCCTVHCFHIAAVRYVF